eukprot:4574061-Alexandrium_andersonii.AAC.1
MDPKAVDVAELAAQEAKMPSLDAKAWPCPCFELVVVMCFLSACAPCLQCYPTTCFVARMLNSGFALHVVVWPICRSPLRNQLTASNMH